jgi:hypothetical protein
MATDITPERPPTSPSALKEKLVAGTALVLLFGSGVVVGLAWDQTANAATPDGLSVDRRSDRDRPHRRMVVENVGLSVAQKTAVDSLVVFHRQRMSDLDHEFRPRYGGVIADLREEIKGVLTDDQRGQYDVLLTEHEAERAARRRNNSRK